MKKALLTLLAMVFFVGLLGAAGYVGYRYGYDQGVLTTSDGNPQFFSPRDFEFGLRRMPMFGFGFNRELDRHGFGMMQRGFGFGFGFFPALGLLLRLLFWGLVIWAVYMLATRSGWRLTRTTQTTQTTETQSRTTETDPLE